MYNVSPLAAPEHAAYVVPDPSMLAVVWWAREGEVIPMLEPPSNFPTTDPGTGAWLRVAKRGSGDK